MTDSVIDVSNVSTGDLARTLAALPQGTTARFRDVTHLNEIVLMDIVRDIINDRYACDLVIGNDLITKVIATRISANISQLHSKRRWSAYTANAGYTPGTVPTSTNPDLLCPMCDKIGYHQIPKRHPETQVMGIQWTCVRGMDGWWEEPSKRAIRSLINQEKRVVNQRTAKVMKSINKKTRKGENVTYVMNAYERAARGKMLMRRLDQAAKRRSEKKKTKEEKAYEKERLKEERQWRAIERGRTIASRKLDDSGVTMTDALPISGGLTLKIKCGDTVQEKFIERKMLMPGLGEGKPGERGAGGGLCHVDDSPRHCLRASDGTTYKLRSKEGGRRKDTDCHDEAHDEDAATNVTHLGQGVKGCE